MCNRFGFLARTTWSPLGAAARRCSVGRPEGFLVYFYFVLFFKAFLKLMLRERNSSMRAQHRGLPPARPLGGQARIPGGALPVRLAALQCTGRRPPTEPPRPGPGLPSLNGLWTRGLKHKSAVGCRASLTGLGSGAPGAGLTPRDRPPRPPGACGCGNGERPPMVRLPRARGHGPPALPSASVGFHKLLLLEQQLRARGKSGHAWRC